MVCARCRRSNPTQSRFCNGCGAALLPAPTAGETRRIVTALFCDVVGSTPLGEQLDPEVLRRVLHRYFDEMRDVVEAHGGQVSKFIGDAVVGVFGVVQAHEDDALRAVRAADEMRARLVTLNESLRRSWGLELASRTGVCTGEVVVGEDDEVVLGDVMNTAARLERAAEGGEILIADVTADLVQDAVEAERLELAVKGKATPVIAWRVTAVDRKAAGHRRRFDRPLVGRAAELRALEELLDTARFERRLQLALVVGEAGIGKSRLVAELERRVDDSGAAVTRRHGRCLAYGDGIGFWPLAEIVKQHLSLADTHDLELARSRLAAAVDGMRDAPWLRARLAPLVGLPAEVADRDEVFAAWQRFFDEVAAAAPLLLVIEDLHWADPAVLAFVQHLSAWSSGVPILVVCTARHELLDVYPDWIDGLSNATTLVLTPLTRGDTAQLVVRLLADAGAADDATTLLIDRSAGNPLYAEEYVRLFADRGSDVSPELQMPDSVRAVIAARLDALPPDTRGLLRDAAVMGKVFSTAALAAISNRALDAARDTLLELARREVVRSARASEASDDDQFAFWHDLVHEVVYDQIPRLERADKHRRTAEWIERTAGERIAERAELLAHHYGQALALRRATGHGELEPLRRAALRHATTAAEDAMALDARRAMRLARQGLELTVDADPERARLLCVLGTALVNEGAFADARELLRSSRAAAAGVGDAGTLGAAFLQEAVSFYIAGEGQRWGEICEEAIERLRRERPTGELSVMLTHASVCRLFRHDMDAAVELVERGLEVAIGHDDPSAIAFALTCRGLLRSETSDAGALEDFERAVQIAVAAGSPWSAMTRFHMGLGRLVWTGPASAEEVMLEAIEDGVRTRNASMETFARVVDVLRRGDGADWDELVPAAHRALEWADANRALQYRTRAAAPLGRVLALRGDIAGARRAMDGVLAQARGIIDGQALIPALATSALIECLDGRAAAARALASEIVPGWLHGTSPIGDVLRVLVACDGAAHARLLLDALGDGPPRVLHAIVSGRALLAELDGQSEASSARYGDAATRWRGFGNPYEQAHALAGRARCLSELGRAEEASNAANEAATLFARLGVARPEALTPVARRLGARPSAVASVAAPPC